MMDYDQAADVAIINDVAGATPDETVSVQVEAMEPGEIPLDRGVAVQVVSAAERPTMGETVRLIGSRRAVAAILLDLWASGPEGDVDWLRATMLDAEPLCPSR